MTQNRLKGWNKQTYCYTRSEDAEFKPGLRGVNVTAARGCPFTCTFCQPVLDAMFGKKLRQRSPASVIAELRLLKARYDIEAFWFTDDTFTNHNAASISNARTNAGCNGMPPKHDGAQGEARKGEEIRSRIHAHFTKHEHIELQSGNAAPNDP